MYILLSQLICCATYILTPLTVSFNFYHKSTRRVEVIPLYINLHGYVSEKMKYKNIKFD